MQKKLISTAFFLVFAQLVIAQCWQSVAASFANSYAIKSDGTLWACGWNYDGSIGDGTNIAKNIFVQTGTDTNWRHIEAGTGAAHVLAQKTDGSLWAWGWNANGQLGDGTNISKNSPIQVGLDTDWQFVSAGLLFNMAIKTDGSLWAWGDNEFGQLGDGSNTHKFTLTRIGTDNNWQTIAAGYQHTIAIRSDGTLWAWGRNDYGQLGNGTLTNTNNPTQIGNDSDWQKISAGFGYSMAIKTDGTLWVWGRNDFGELGDSTYINKITPTQNGNANNWQTVKAGFHHSMATKSTGALWGWGLNLGYQLGDSSVFKKNMPTQIGMFAQWQGVSIGYQHVLALTTDHTLFSWGWGEFGQLGNAANPLQSEQNSIECPSSGIDQIGHNIYVNIYPNPVEEAIVFDWPGNGQEVLTYSIINQIGNVVIVNQTTLLENQIKVESILPGYYILVLKSNKYYFAKSFVKI